MQAAPTAVHGGYIYIYYAQAVPAVQSSNMQLHPRVHENPPPLSHIHVTPAGGTQTGLISKYSTTFTNILHPSLRKNENHYLALVFGGVSPFPRAAIFPASKQALSPTVTHYDMQQVRVTLYTNQEASICDPEDLSPHSRSQLKTFVVWPIIPRGLYSHCLVFRR